MERELSRPTRKINEHLRDALLHLENTGLSEASKDEVRGLLEKISQIVNGGKS